MQEFLKNLIAKHKGNIFILLVCSALSAGTSVLTTNQTGWVEDDIKFLIEHHIEEKYGFQAGELEAREKAMVQRKQPVQKPSQHSAR